jgi:uncharacterized protein YjdB
MYKNGEKLWRKIKMVKTFEKSIIKLLAFAMVCIFFMPTTKVFAASTVKVTGVTLNTTSLSLEKGNTSTLMATVAPSTATDKEVRWKSSNPKVAKVDSNGKITAVNKGAATITCTAKDRSKKKAICKVTVTKDSVSSTKVTRIALDKTSLRLQKGDTSSLTATVTPSTVSNKNVIWKSSNRKVAKVDGNGNITAVKKGTATITCKAKDGSNKKVTCKVTVTN